MNTLEDRVLHALTHTSDKQKAPALNQVFNTGPRRGALESLARLRERVSKQDNSMRYWTEVWIVEHRVFERYLALMTAEEQTFALLQHADWMDRIKPQAKLDQMLDAATWSFYIQAACITPAHTSTRTTSAQWSNAQ